jgi:signal transduction histidine kinase
MAFPVSLPNHPFLLIREDITVSLRRRSVLLRVALLVLVPLVLLIGLFSYQVVTSVSGALTLIRSKVVMDDLGQPIANLQQALTRERAQMVVYGAAPTPAARAALQREQAATDRAVASLTAAVGSTSVMQSASATGEKAIATLRAGLASLPGLRARIADQSVGGQQAFTAYGDLIAAAYQVLEQAIIQEGNSTQVLPGIAVIELAVSNEYLQQESALLGGDFAARSFPAADHQAFVRLVGAHRLLYAQSYSYLSPADRGHLDRDVSPAASAALTAMENKLVAGGSPRAAPPVRPQVWNSAVATVSRQTQQAVGQAEAGLASQARSQASDKLRTLYLAGGLGLAAVLASLALSLWIAINLARQLHGLRDSALEMANVRLPDVVRRLRAGDDVDVAGQVPPLEPGADEIGQVKAAFNTAQRTAVEAAVDEARMRRGVNDVFRNLARRSQALLERQMALLDGMERRAAEPDDLDNLFRVDHLTTRMRRHAESLIVLAGDSAKRTFRDPVPFVDVLRAAAAEVEDYTRIKVICRTPAALAGPAVADVIHLLAEFVENATIFSPPNTEVRVTGDLVAKGFAVDIEDRGLGLSDDEITTINATLSDPPPFDLSGSDRLGIFVAAQLARRHGIRVTVRASAYGGATAIVVIPRDLVVPEGGFARAVVPGRAPSGRLTTAVGHVLPPRSGNGGPPAAASVLPSAVSIPDFPPPLPVTVSEALATPGGHLGASSEILGMSSEPAGSGQPVLAGAARHDLGDPADSPPGVPGVTENGLPRRVRQASLAPQLRGAAPAPPAAAADSARSPDTARSVMSAFWRGRRRGLSEAAADPDLPVNGEEG